MSIQKSQCNYNKVSGTYHPRYSKLDKRHAFIIILNQLCSLQMTTLGGLKLLCYNKSQNTHVIFKKKLF